LGLDYEQPAPVAEPRKQEPVEWGVDWGRAGDIPCVIIIKRLPDGRIEVVAVEYAPYEYNTPAQRTWVGLTDEERDAMIGVTDLSGTYYYDDLYAVILAAEGKLAEKNT
jgi:hypothetical protein